MPTPRDSRRLQRIELAGRELSKRQFGRSASMYLPEWEVCPTIREFCAPAHARLPEHRAVRGRWPVDTRPLCHDAAEVSVFSFDEPSSLPSPRWAKMKRALTE